MEAVLEMLSELGERPDAPPEKVAGGRSDTGVWRFRSSKGLGWCALRVFHPRDAGTAARETAVMVHARANGFSVPAVFVSRMILGRPLMVIEWIDGGSMFAGLARRPWRAGELGARSGRLLAELHRTPAPAGLAPARDWPAPSAFPAELRQRLLADDVGAETLLHLDFHPGNIILRDEEPDVLIDWTNARSGDPRFDVARTLAIGALIPGSSTLERTVGRRLFDPWVRALRSAYAAAAGAPAGMPVFLAWAGYGMLAEWRFKRRAAGEDEVEEPWEAHLRGLIAGWMAEAGLGDQERAG